MAGSDSLSACEAIDLRLPHWSVRNQLPTGACAAFALTACVESALPHRVDLSEQFLHWAAKQVDAMPSHEGSSLIDAAMALARFGICTRVMHDPADQAHLPCAEALADAATRRMTPRIAGSGGDAATIYNALSTFRRPVAISLPVFSTGEFDNWNYYEAVRFGVIQDPAPGALRRYLHAVCITGFVPDEDAPGGGWFVFRNSWGIAWGWQLPAPGYAAPEPGYGQVSAGYVTQYAKEHVQL